MADGIIAVPCVGKRSGGGGLCVSLSLPTIDYVVEGGEREPFDPKADRLKKSGNRFTSYSPLIVNLHSKTAWLILYGQTQHFNQ